MTRPALTASQLDLLRRIPDRYPPERLDRLWIFAPQIGKAREFGFVVLSLLPDPGSNQDRRTLVTLRYEAEQVKGTIHRHERVDEEGRAPAERIERVIAGVLARSGPETPDPIVEEIAGNPDRWVDIGKQLGF